MAPSGGIGASELQRFIVNGTEPLSSINKLVMRGALTKFGTLKTISTYKEGFLLIFSEITDRDGLLAVRSICDKQVTISWDNVSKGTVFCVDFMDSSDEIISDQLPEGVFLLRRLPSRGSQSVLKSGRLLLEFSSSTAPPHLILKCNLRLEVRPYIPAPLRCRNCLEYGHHERACEVPEARCGYCGQSGHSTDTCTAEVPSCYACGMRHAISSPDCMVWRKEMSVNIVRLTQGVTSAKARRIVNGTQVPRPNTALLPDLQPISAPVEVPTQPITTQPAMSYANVTSNAALPPPSTQKEERSLSHTLESLICQQMSLLETLVAQNATIVQQNQQIIKLLSAPKYKQSTLTSTMTRTSSLGTLSDTQHNKRTADEPLSTELQSKKQQRTTQPTSKKDQRT